MALTMRPAGLSSGIDKDRGDYTVFCGEWNIGRIYENTLIGSNSRITKYRAPVEKDSSVSSL
jgi:hypothetical protein